MLESASTTYTKTARLATSRAGSVEISRMNDLITRLRRNTRSKLAIEAADALEQAQAEYKNVVAKNQLQRERLDFTATRIEQLEAAMHEFVDRCAKGEVLSKYTRAKFERLLAGDSGS